ncbi:hypothetical protein F8388_026539 [Cannabis sativa]|uniref:DUF4283 domain-containing protein n=1 Tax=Cannabis sativa TaxID=3483 RepID=A0A7J6DXH2_CANSA|nr:hypothetical protein F8388_026539 [Cannabis sativa]
MNLRDRSAGEHEVALHREIKAKSARESAKMAERENEEFGDDITFSLNPGEVDEPQESNQVLIGKILSRYKLGKVAIQGSLRLSWSAIKGWKWKEIEDGLMKFMFANRSDAMNVLARRPWFVCGSLMVIMPWPSWLTPSEIRFDKTPMWVRIESIPPFYWNLSNLKELASRASPVYELPQGIEDAIGMSNLK